MENRRERCPRVGRADHVVGLAPHQPTVPVQGSPHPYYYGPLGDLHCWAYGDTELVLHKEALWYPVCILQGASA